MNPEEEWLIVQPEITEDNIIVREAVKEKTSSSYIYGRESVEKGEIQILIKIFLIGSLDWSQSCAQS